MSQHSPGPWEVGYRAMNVMASDDKGAFPVCDIRGWGHLTGRGYAALGLSDDEAVAIQAANARLIAAGPEMLALLRELRKWIDRDLGSWEAQLITRIDALIAKAVVGKGEAG